MNSREYNFDIDEMLFLAEVINGEMQILDATDQFTAGLGPLGDSIQSIAKERIEEAQFALDKLIEEDTTWHDPPSPTGPSSL